MLDSLTKRNKNKKRSKAFDLLNKGLILIEGKEYKQATIELTLALEENPVDVINRLEQTFSDFSHEADYAGMKAVGLVLLKKRKDDSELLNTLGNCSRRLKECKQANHFYRQALKADPSYLIAFHNLAASIADVELYDAQIADSLSRFSDFHDLVLPDYRNHRVIDASDSFEANCERLKTAIKENWKNRSISEGKMILQSDIYNLGLYALTQKKIQLALDNFQKLRRQKSDIPYLDMLLAISNHYNGQEPSITIKVIQELLVKNPSDRCLNANLAILYKKTGNALQANKYFLICGRLLDKSAGFFSFQSLIRAADQKYEERDYEAALNYYQKASDEVDTVDLWEKIGNLHLKLKNINEAVVAFNQILRLEPESATVKQRLHQLYKQYLETAHSLVKQKKYEQAIVILERALQIERPPELLEETARIYKMMRKFDKAEPLLEESENTRIRIKDKESEKERQRFIVKGKEYTKRKEFTAAIDNLEKASRIKLDKDVFMYLAHIYKGLKRTRALQDLMNRWHRQNDSRDEEEDR